MTDRRRRWLEGKRLNTRGAFWFVWAPEALRPSKQYSSLAAALEDAEALRAKYPEREFLVYRAELVLGPAPDPASRGAATGSPGVGADAKTSPNVGRSSAPPGSNNSSGAGTLTRPTGGKSFASIALPEPPKAERLGRPRLTLRRAAR